MRGKQLRWSAAMHPSIRSLFSIHFGVDVGETEIVRPSLRGLNLCAASMALPLQEREVTFELSPPPPTAPAPPFFLLYFYKLTMLSPPHLMSMFLTSIRDPGSMLLSSWTAHRANKIQRNLSIGAVTRLCEKLSRFHICMACTL